MNYSRQQIWDYLIERNFFTEVELQLLTDVAGYSRETFDNACFSRFGYDFDFDGLIRENGGI